MTLALLGCIDSLLTSVVADNMTKTIMNPIKNWWDKVLETVWAPSLGDSSEQVRTMNGRQHQVGRENPFIGYDCWLLLLLFLLAIGPIASQIPQQS